MTKHYKLFTAFASPRSNQMPLAQTLTEMIETQHSKG